MPPWSKKTGAEGTPGVNLEHRRTALKWGTTQFQHVQTAKDVARKRRRRGLPIERFSTWLVENSAFNTSMTFITIWALFGEDIRIARSLAEADIIYMYLTIVCLLMFSIEITVSCIGKPDFPWSFFFYLDLVATSSMLFDIKPVMDFLVSLFAGDEDEGEEGGSESQAGQQAKAGRAGRAGAKAGRVVRIIRLIRLVRIFKLWKQVEKGRAAPKVAKKWGRQSGEEATDNMDEMDEKASESLLSRKMSDMTTRKVIVLVLVMIIGVPNFTVESWFESAMPSAEFGAHQLALSHVSAACADPSAPPAPFGDDGWPCHLVATGNHSGTKDEQIAKWGPDYVESLYEVFESQLLLYIYNHIHVGYSTGTLTNLIWLDLNTGYFPPIQRLNTADNKAKFKQWFVDDCDYEKSIKNMKPTEVLDTCMSDADIDGLWTSITSLEPNHDCTDADGNLERGISFFREFPQDKLLCPSHLRENEMAPYGNNFGIFLRNSDFEITFSTRQFAVAEANFSIVQTLFVCVVLCIGALLISSDANNLVLRPIERMITMMQEIRKDPLVATRLGMEQEKEMMERAAKEQEKTGFRAKVRFIVLLITSCGRRRNAGAGSAASMETVILERTLIKLGGLLALGFGEAGIDVVGENLKEKSGLNAMIAGRTMEAIFGYCDIRSFTVAAEVLQAKVMVFVNQIAEILHAIVDIHCGAPNKNIGDAFLVVWLIDARRKEDIPLKQSRMSELAVLAFAKSHAAVTKSPVLQEYAKHPGLIARILNYRVRLGFGLHMGWAIEGAIGSQYKIDPSYLSPHVALTGKLEAATKLYNVPILASHYLVETMDPEFRALLRQADSVYLPGSKNAVKLYCLDLDTEALAPKDYKAKAKPKLKFKVRQVRDCQKNDHADTDVDMRAHLQFEKDPSLQILRKKYTTTFFKTFQKGYLNYRAGEWEVAMEALEESDQMLGSSDGPSRCLLDYMAELKTPPKGWGGSTTTGRRNLTMM
jgi:class 3 adenylate cyclase